MTQSTDEFLAHFGVKGMHWGVRKREDGKPIQYETAATGGRDGAPAPGSDRIRVPAGMSKRQAYKQARLDWERKTGHKTSQRNFNWDPKDPIRTDYTREEILGARERSKARKKAFYTAAKNGDLSKLPWSELNYDQTRDASVSKFHTRGERTVAAILGGPAGAYLASNTAGRQRYRELNKRI